MLAGRPELDVELLKGSGPPAPGERVVRTLLRDTGAARLLARAAKREPFVVEHLSFGAGVIPVLQREVPDVVYFSEWHVGRALAAWRRVARRRLALVFCNGALAAGPYGHLDHVQQIVPGTFDYVVGRGVSSHNQAVLPLGVAVDRVARFIGANDRAALRRRLGLPAERAIVLSVGAVNRQKRMDYVIEEIAALPEPRPFLLIAGQLERESPDIAALARERLGPHGHDIRTVAPAEMPDLYRAADVFVLASLWESFGRVLVEAQAHGLPCLAHDYPVMRWVLGEHGRLGDLTRPGVLARMVIEIDESDTTPTAHAARHQAAYERFSWDVLAPRYVDMLQRVAGREVSAAASQTTR